MPLMPCPDCGNEVSAAAPVCIHCGRPLPRGATVPPSLSRLWRRFTHVAAIGVAVLFGLALLIAVLPDPPPSPPSAYEAALYCQDFVRDRLLSPSTATFPDAIHAAVVRDDSMTFTVRSYVDAENAFGATLRRDFTCRAHKVADTWVLDALSGI